MCHTKSLMPSGFEEEIAQSVRNSIIDCPIKIDFNRFDSHTSF